MKEYIHNDGVEVSKEHYLRITDNNVRNKYDCDKYNDINNNNKKR